jgi:hypothetical protein
MLHLYVADFCSKMNAAERFVPIWDVWLRSSVSAAR